MLIIIGDSNSAYRKTERIPRLSATLQYRLLSVDSFESPILLLQLLLAVAVDRPDPESLELRVHTD